VFGEGGMVIANDADAKRAHLLVHQLKRLGSASFLVTNHDGQVPSYPHTLFHFSITVGIVITRNVSCAYSSFQIYLLLTKRMVSQPQMQHHRHRHHQTKLNPRWYQVVMVKLVLMNVMYYIACISILHIHLHHSSLLSLPSFRRLPLFCDMMATIVITI
jgi:hypothetical protein